ncbi:hypothetical protein EST38_g13479 [Candolleomyces aberdarensis]|uniref:Tyr recombinase domain-containing protein n=1 Tax=Candolleomyces aberdarensis TaxID=2316362 RepID=A0A4Q2D244_9AGAR|nr:hypothetical protein EST38_g13479 [Candolleomyces aberdarensis]
MVFHTYCDKREPPVPEDMRAPVETPVLLDFLTCCAGLYSGSAAKNYVYGVKAWHTVHALPWRVDENQLTAALSAVEKMTPPSSRRPKRHPVTVDWLCKVAGQLDMSKPLDVAVFACLTTVFWSVSRLGEFVVPSVDSFDPAAHITRSCVSQGTEGRLGLPVTTFNLPRTKKAPNGEPAQWSSQRGATDPEAALAAHFTINNPGENDHLFAWRSTGNKLVPLSRRTFFRRVERAVAAAGLESMNGHGLRIGGVLEFLLRGVSFEVVKVLGRWSSDAFLLYLRKHGAILAPYIQDTPVLEPFTRIAMPSRIR